MLEKILKIIDIINSCKTIEQLEQCTFIIDNFERDEIPQDDRIIGGLMSYYKLKLNELKRIPYLESL